MSKENQLKLVHTADLHLGMHFHDMSHEKRNERIDDFFKNLREIVNFAIERKCDFFIIAGDIFSNPLPRGEIFNRFAKLMGDLLANGIKVIVAAGNHDTPASFIQRNTALGLHLAGLRDFIYVDQRSIFKPTILEGKHSRKKVAFYIIPFIYPETVTLDETNIADYEKRIFEIFDSQFVEKDVDYSLGVAHLTVEGAKYSSQIEPLFTYEIKVRKSLLRKMIKIADIAYFALGHIHRYQEIDNKIVYSGSIERINFSEINETKGFLYIHEERGELVKEFIPHQCRKMIEIRKEIPSYETPWKEFSSLESWLSGLDAREIKDAMIKLEIKYPREYGHSINWRRLFNLLYRKGAFHVKIEKILTESKGREIIRERKKKRFEDLIEEYVKNIPELRGNESLRNRVVIWIKRILGEIRQAT